MLRISRLALGLLLPLASAHAQATWYVDAAAAAPGDGSLAAPFPTIQQAVDAAAAEDVVSVAPGEYVENVVCGRGILVESQAGPLETTLRAAGPGSAFHAADLEGAALRGFTVTQSDVGVSDVEIVVVERCILTGNAIGSLGIGPILRHCTITGNDVGVQEAGSYGAAVLDSVVWGNATWDYFGPGAFLFAIFEESVGFQKFHSSGSWSFDDVLVVDPMLWGPAYGELHLKPGSPCIGLAEDGDAGALAFDAAYGASYQDLGHALAGAAGAPTLSGQGYMFAGQLVSLAIAGGAPGGAALLVLGTSAAFAPVLGGTLVPAPGVVLSVGVVDGAGALSVPVVVWPIGVPSGMEFYAQAWIVDAGGPAGFAATNGVLASAP